VIDHPFLNLIRQPNPKMDEAAFFRAWSVSRQVTGEFYCEIIRSGIDVPVELYPLDPSAVDPIVSRDDNGDNLLVGYEWSDGARKKFIEPQNMLTMNEWNLGGTLAPIAVALRNLDSDAKHTDYIRAFWENAGVPYGILTVNEKLSDQKAAELRDDWQAKHGNKFSQQHKIAVLDQRATFQKVGANLDEIVSIALRETDESRICMALGVSPLIVYSYFGMAHSTLSNLDGAWENFWKTTMSSDLKLARSWLTLSLLPQFILPSQIRRGEYKLAWDLSDVGALQENVDAATDRSLKKWGAGLLTLNEARRETGYIDYPDTALGDLNAFQVVAIANLLAQLAPVNGEDDDELPEISALTDIRYAIAHMSQRIAALGDENKTGDDLKWLQPPTNGHLITAEQ
jgi:HK97 family phage portal protein